MLVLATAEKDKDTEVCSTQTVESIQAHEIDVTDGAFRAQTGDTLSLLNIKYKPYPHLPLSSVFVWYIEEPLFTDLWGLAVDLKQKNNKNLWI